MSSPRGSRLGRTWTTFVSHMEPRVFLPAAALVILFVFLGSVASERMGSTFEAARGFIFHAFGWFYVLGATVILGLVLYLIGSRYGDVRLGSDDERPEHSRAAWLAMLFSAGMGTGLVYWGVAEPVHHFVAPPPGLGGLDAASLGDGERRVRALAITFFHWGLHPWAIYTLFATSVAYFHFRRGLPLAPRSMLYPLLGDRIFGWPGHLVDVVATVGTLFGVATSLGFGAQQVNAGLALLIEGPESSDLGLQLGLIAGMTAVATVSVVLGLKDGIRRLSAFNMLLGAGLLLFVLFAGPTGEIPRQLTSALGAYAGELQDRSLLVRPVSEGGWQEEWTLFYWSWWISWSPFVGVFVARISKGRTLRELTATVLFVPAGVTFVWLAVMGTAGLEALGGPGGEALAEAARSAPATALHRLLAELPAPKLTMSLATLLIVVFFISSSDSGSLVDDMVTSGGDPNPPRVQRVFWAVSEGAVAAVLLAAGGLSALRTASLQSALPMLVVLLAAGWALLRGLEEER